MALTSKQFCRYERHITLQGFEEKGQEKLLGSKVLIVGAGGLGVPAAMYIAASGVGNLTILDNDEVSISNLHRQVSYNPADCSKPKAFLLKERLMNQNPEINILAEKCRVNTDNAERFIVDHDLIIDSSDNFETRYLLNALCVKHKKPLISGSLLFADGQLSTFRGFEANNPCYQCIYPHSPTPAEAPSCTEAAVLGPIAGVIGTMMAVETLKELAGYGPSLAGQLLIYSGKNSDFTKVKLNKNLSCPVCSIRK